ncbi:MAG: hypothetical protein UR54_C0010G0006 [Candidatus Roizmanbacteria bacterium GW2011_GWA2_34_18]|uniref:Uncharacterized protein n=1 Tax=Candidatus Roizmanbacteria bacterium GW2011_GWA2_34_18 TaxID=1618477 RepID=A0A0G0ATX2_9BACT|nr:MAG: hypothetical protein UR54_C0010G0006 [Candidatus Roizmanbacteria bacterium GW2011_GWA2_34_18]
MDSQNIKVYLAISGALIILLILVIIIPFTKKSSTTSTTQPTPYNLRPTTVETNPSPNNQSPDNNTVPADFTGVAEEELSPEVIDISLQKKDLRQKTPLDFSTFSIDFNYGEDKFIVTFKDPKDQAQKEFNSWRLINYPGLGTDQFLLK